MRTVVQAFTKGQCGSHYLIADVGKFEGLTLQPQTPNETMGTSVQLGAGTAQCHNY